MRLVMESVPQLQRLGVFEAVGRLGSFTSAARELGISQPAVSRHIGMLEKQLGLALFDRGVNHIELTGDGKILHDSVTESFALIEQALDSLQSTNSRFTIATQPSTAQSWLAPRLDELRERLDPCSLSLLVFDREDELDSLDYDAVIRSGSGVWPGQRAERLIAETVVPVASLELAKKFGLEATSPPSALFDAPLLDINRQGRPWMSWQQWFAFQGEKYVPPTDSIEYDSYSTLLNQAISGIGITLSWRHLRGDYVERGLLVEVGPVVHNPSAGHYLAWAPALDRDSRIRVLRDFLDEVVPAEPHRETPITPT